MYSFEQFADKLKALFAETIVTVSEIPVRAVNIEDKIYTPTFLLSQLKFEGSILTIPNNSDKSYFLITEENYHNWHFLKSTDIRTKDNHLIYDYDIISFIKYKKTIFGNDSWKIEDAPPPFIVTFDNSRTVPEISILKPFPNMYLIAGVFTKERISEIIARYGFSIFLMGNFAIPSKMNADLFTVPNVQLTTDAANYK